MLGQLRAPSWARNVLQTHSAQEPSQEGRQDAHSAQAADYATRSKDSLHHWSARSVAISCENSNL